MQFTFYIATLKKKKKKIKGFFFSFAYFLLFGVCRHQESQFISEIAPKYKHLTIYRPGIYWKHFFFFRKKYMAGVQCSSIVNHKVIRFINLPKKKKVNTNCTRHKKPILNQQKSRTWLVFYLGVTVKMSNLNLQWMLVNSELLLNAGPSGRLVKII